MKKNESIRKIMSHTPFTGTVNNSFSEVVKKMQDNAIHHLPIVSGKELVGMLSSTDILRSSYSDIFIAPEKAAESLDSTVKIENIMKKDLTSLKDTDTVRHAADILSTSEFNSIPVVNESKHLVGIVTSKDIIGYLVDQY